MLYLPTIIRDKGRLGFQIKQSDIIGKGHITQSYDLSILVYLTLRELYFLGEKQVNMIVILNNYLHNGVWYLVL